ncbi:hypothetical protein [Neobacillus cucumis]|uniref:hypothetical protein n=1 Tax=Neobacillus cucumis TaxID=1740721 RepID=UPI0028534B72|nr:hypothetical protein [Neobacillus cucumis]MDR4946990.1 hypothetical protein [Neobacillus cucumis]
MKTFKALSYGTVGLLILIGIGAVLAGLGFILEPDGSGLGMSVKLLKDSPFNDFLIPGITLLVVNGILSLVVAYLVYIENRYAGNATIVLGIAMIIWISAQVYWIGWVSGLQPLLLVIGCIEMGLGYYLNRVYNRPHGMFKSNSHHDSHAH